MVHRIISGGQTGADRAALDTAIRLGVESGGWVPKGRAAEDGRIAAAYPNLIETDSADPSVRTQLNVRDSDATVVLTHGAPQGGSALTLEIASRIGKPALWLDITDLGAALASSRLAQWLVQVRPSILNVAGPRESEDPQIYEATAVILSSALRPRHEPT